ncbi:Mus7/MMS22 family-domain-containing protein [Aspergillus pseudonomiae]|uniref:Mus7/MMS22 family-domain-containing protein n=1 Tax=Aspergillus pseudonomiae TaxID=1506151 RepID=A0A5N7DE16_9EURO|nr:Mus7/MMS22 family-domain-containing protein [Aspergillus pseudonomiae]KAE8404642.1 Mus7/MMS22 family-domain-containing protein [Aspergillus pseudonomiae]
MESWRERGFVPDSDEDDGLDSPEKVNQDLDGSDDELGASPTPDTLGTTPQAPEGKDTKEESHHSSQGGIVENFRPVISSPDVDNVPVQANEEAKSLAKEVPDKQARDIATEPLSEDFDDEVATPTRKAHPSPTLSATPRPRPSPPSTPLREQSEDIWEVQSSSPDELQLVDLISRRSIGLHSKAPGTGEQQKDNENADPSPLSSPLSSLHSSTLGEGDEHDQQNTGNTESPPPESNLDALLPPLEIPEDILREMSQPARRSLRQRNPIQLHPYLLENAKYQKLMKARGIKPVPAAQYQQAMQAAAEGQGQSFDSTLPPSSSPTADFEFAPSSPPERNSISTGKAPQDLHGSQPHSLHQDLSENEIRGPKRRKVSRPDDHRNLLRHQPRPTVVITNRASPINLNSSLARDILPSPPRSGSNSSPQALWNPAEFRFPRGFTPPTLNTPNTAPRREGRDATTTAYGSRSDVDGEPVDVRSTASQHSHSASENDGEDEEGEEPEEDVRELQRRIKGVLPASWLRLDQQRQKDAQLSSTQRNRDKNSRIENAKGVAKKIIKRTGPSTSSNPVEHLASLRDLAESDGSDTDEDDRNGGQTNARQILANLVGFDDTFLAEDMGEDIPEDNRIDYMFPSATRENTAPRTQKGGQKRQRPESHFARSDSHPKRPRLKKQARLTDPIYRREKKKYPSHTPPKLGILDAPDVASRPRNEQPQFLRVAARKARSRQDKGRRSPSNKVIKMSSALDTEDANTSLREWRAGRIRQSKLPRAQAKAPRRPPLADLSSNKKVGPRNLGSGEINKDHHSTAGPATRPDDINVVRSQTPDPEAPPPTTALPTSKKPMQRIQYGNNWFVRRNVVVSSLKRNDPRPVGLEMASLNVSRAPSFQRSLSLLNQNARQKRLPETVDRNIILNRFLVDSSQAAVHAKSRGSTFTRESNDVSVSLPKRPVQIKRKLKKRTPMRLDVSTAEDTNPLILSAELDPPRVQGEDANPSQGVSDGLSGFQRSYSTDFGITPLGLGTFFHESSFIGSGEFHRSLELGKRNLDQETGIFTANVGDRTFRWGPWNDAVSSELGIAFDTMLEEMEKNDTMSTEAALENASNRTYIIYRTLVKYVTETLTFIDPIDRTGFITRAYVLISKVNDNLTALVSATARGTEHRTKIASYNVVFANLTYQIACHTLVNGSVKEEVLELVKSVSRQAFTAISDSVGKINIRKFLEDNKVCEQRDKGVRDEYPAVEAYVIVQHILYSTEKLKGCFEGLIADSLLSTGDLSNTKDIDHLESRWHWLLTTLPLGEIDALGIARIGSRFRGTCNNWTIVKHFLCPVLESYEPNTSASISYNTYCRTLFHRCFLLINGWGWRDCKLILDTLYDFFARNTLYNLKQEENYTSPSFLDELDHNPSIDVTPSDPCFHIFLKLIASGLRFLSKLYDKKKVRNFAWRLLPNHGRVYPKEQPIHQADLDALRNHHDLLCTLYFAVPDGCRPRLEAIKNLVHPANSHRETCNISIRSWARLVRFKLSTDEDVSGLEAFADWHSYFVSEFIKQHMLARREIEAQNTKDNQFSHQLIERTISQNQRQIESLLKTALSSLQNAIQSAPTLEHAHRLISKSPIGMVLGLFNSRLARVNTTVSEALQMLKAYVHKCNSVSTTGSANPPAPVDEDSQEYGDWADIEAMYGDEFSPATHPQGIEYVEKALHPAVSQLVSNCFGEDHCPEDAILLSVVDCWTSIAQVLVKNRFRHWDNYLSLYDGDSWAGLRKTVQTRKFTPKFLASCIEKDARFISECKMQVLGMWMSSLVERVSMLKFQHSLTEALLNCDPTNTLLQNLPFSVDRKHGRYSITLEELSQRRLSLISSLLSNMRAHIQDLEIAASKTLSTEKQEYRELIQTMMSSMKANYQELGSSAASAQGVYVDFVHRIVGFLQQHTRDICPIDPFFTDPTSFPLPSTDPTYIVARLKGYEPKLSSEKVAKTLIMFIQGISERAAIDGQQVYLVDQLQTSIAHTYEVGDPARPTLRATLLQSVFPAYLQTAFSNPGAWLLSQPIIQTISHTFKELLFHIDTTDTNCVASVVGIFSSVFQSSYHALHNIIDNINMLKEPPVVITVASFIEMITSSLRVVDYIDRATDAGENIIAQIQAFRQFILFSTSFLHDQLLITDPENIPHPTNIFTSESTPTNAPAFFNEIRISATRELQTYINESWSRHQGKYYFTRRGGHQPQEVNLEPSVAANLENFPLAIFDDAARKFLDTLRALDSFDTFH